MSGTAALQALTSLHDVYFSILLDVSVVVIFLFLFKVVLFYFMLMFGKTIQDDTAVVPEQATPKRHFWAFWRTQEVNGTREASGRKVVWIGLGLFWLISGLVQINPIMVNHSLTVVIGRVSVAQPHWISGLLQAIGQVWTSHPAWFNILSIFVQLSIGSLVLLYRNRLPGCVGLWLSLLWSIGIWVFTEGLGHIFSGDASLILGTPGPAFMSLLCTVFLLLPAPKWGEQSYRMTRRYAYLLIWLLIICLHLVPSSPFWHTGDFTKTAHLTFNANTEGFEMGVGQKLADFIAPWVSTYNILFAVISLVLAGIIVSRPNSIAMLLTTLWFIFLWMLADLGMQGSMGANLGPLPLLTAYMLSLYFDSKHSKSTT
jgi:hypothetical protein